MIYTIKKKINKGFKSIHNFILKFGIDINFVKKEDAVSAIQHNLMSTIDEKYSSPEHIYDVTSREHQIFFSEIIDLIIQHNIDLNGKTVADVGCGIGNLLEHVRQCFNLSESSGFDFSQVAIDFAKRRGIGSDFYQHDIYQSFGMKFEFIFCTEVLEHLLYPDKAISNLLAAIQPGGGLLITVPDGRKDTFAGHINFWSPESWQVFIQEKFDGLKFVTGNITERNLYALIINLSNEK